MFIILFDRGDDSAILICPFCGDSFPVPDGMTYLAGKTDPSADSIIREHKVQIEGGVKACTQQRWKSVAYEVRDVENETVIDAGTFEVSPIPKVDWDN